MDLLADDPMRTYEVIVDTLEFLGIVLGVVLSILVLLRFSHQVGLWMGELKTEVENMTSVVKSGFESNRHDHLELKTDLRTVAMKTAEYGQRIAKAEQKIDDHMGKDGDS